MNIGKHIHTLLKRKTEVYVAGLGVFKRVYNPATFDAKKNVFMPPVNYIEFDSLSTEGYDFATYIQQWDQVDRSEAISRVERQVAEIQEELTTSGEVSLDSLGYLVSYGNTAVFKPFDLSGFNFEPIETTIKPEDTIAEETEVTEEIGIEQEKSVHADESSATVTEVEVPLQDEVNDVSTFNDGEEDTSSGNRSFVYGIVAALAVLVLGGLYYYSQYYNVTPAAVTVKVQDSIPAAVPLVSMDTNIVIPVDDTTFSNLDTIPTADLLTMVDTRADEKFTVVIGTHRTLAQAYEEAEAFNKDGHSSVRVVTPNLAKNLKRVIWDSYATKEERDSALRYVRKHIKADAWGDMLK